MVVHIFTWIEIKRIRSEIIEISLGCTMVLKIKKTPHAVRHVIISLVPPYEEVRFCLSFKSFGKGKQFYYILYLR